MDREAKEYLKWWAIIALLIVAVQLVGCVRYIETTPYVVLEDTVFSPCDTIGLCTIAKVACSEDNKPIILVRKSHAVGDMPKFTHEHENVHIRQMKADCWGTQKAYLDSLEVRKRMESEAYCAEAQARMKVHKDVAVVSNWYTGMMEALFETNSFVCTIKPP